MHQARERRRLHPAPVKKCAFPKCASSSTEHAEDQSDAAWFAEHPRENLRVRDVSPGDGISAASARYLERKAIAIKATPNPVADDDENVERALKLWNDASEISGTLAEEYLRRRGFRPAWALGSSGAIKSFPRLSGVESLTILVDNDEPDRDGRKAGQDAALQCSQRWTAAGREVIRVAPRDQGADIADLVGGRDERQE
jgi:hypothetical protein